jgi:SAM-dependent methyltransferase
MYIPNYNLISVAEKRGRNLFEPKAVSVTEKQKDNITAGITECCICNSGPCGVAYDLKTYRVLRCRECGLKFVDVPYDENGIKDMEYYWAEDTYRDEVASIREWCGGEMDKIEALTLPGRLLDVGCSFGYLLEVANSRGWEVSGVEISRKIYEKFIGDKARTLNIFNGRLEDAAYESNSFDTVTMFDLIEHLSDPSATLSEVARVIRPSGLLVIETPREESLFKIAANVIFRLSGGRYDYLIRTGYNPHPGGHRLGFTRRSMFKLLKQKGFTPVRFEKRMMPPRMFIRSCMRMKGFFIKRYAFVGAALAMWAFSVAFGMHNRMVVYAKKTGLPVV